MEGGRQIGATAVCSSGEGKYRVWISCRYSNGSVVGLAGPIVERVIRSDGSVRVGISKSVCGVDGVAIDKGVTIY